MPELSRSEKDYMEAIYILTKRSGSVRSIDVASYMDHSKPSVTKAVQNLCAKGYLLKIDHDLVFTDSGKAVAENIFERHCILAHALREMGIDEPTAVKDAQSMERVISDEAVAITANAIRCQKRLTGVCLAPLDMIGTLCG
ncbi:MAG TPA: metal-dependent transcriptional regulator [Bacillota bacterium]|nr:metal-dependent transcriptional regulator [Bacillota bacterium]